MIRTKKSIKKKEIMNQLVTAGYKVFPAYGRTGVELYTLLVIACNKINPNDPAQEYVNLIQRKDRLAQGKKAFININNAIAQGLPVSEDKRTPAERFEAARHQADQEAER